MKSPFFAVSLLCSLAVPAQAAPNDGLTGAYARVEVGRSSFSLASTQPQTGADDHGKAVKVFGGYRFDQHLGVEAGYAALGSFSDSLTVDGVRVQQDGRARSLFAAATGRLPLGESFALHGRLGLSAGRVSGTPVLPASAHLLGSQTSVMYGVGAEYRPRPNVALTLNVDHYGKLSDQVKASAVVLGLHITL
jgi:OOP family OmpA-OmpF porin